VTKRPHKPAAAAARVIVRPPLEILPLPLLQEQALLQRGWARLPLEKKKKVGGRIHKAATHVQAAARVYLL
jgi:hypothetical protein